MTKDESRDLHRLSSTLLRFISRSPDRYPRPRGHSAHFVDECRSLIIFLPPVARRGKGSGRVSPLTRPRPMLPRSIHCRRLSRPFVRDTGNSFAKTSRFFPLPPPPLSNPSRALTLITQRFHGADGSVVALPLLPTANFITGQRGDSRTCDS